MQTTAVGISFARRLPVGFGTFDLGLATRLLSETQTYEKGSGEESSDATDVRLGSFGRLAFGHAAVRLFVDVDVDVSPGRLRREVRLAPVLPPLPSWSAGFALGVVWGD